MNTMGKFSNFLVIFKRELAAYFNSAIAYIFIIIFVLLNGGLFMTQFFVVGRADMRAFFAVLPLLLAVFLPAVSMRLWAEERKGNTQELLLTFPIETRDLILGKFAASFIFYLTALAATLPIPVMLCFLGRPDMGGIIGGYIGAAFLGGLFLAIGILVSGFCRDQIVSFILSMMICFGLYLIGTEFVASSLDGWISGGGTFLRHFLGASDPYDAFAKGVIDTKNLFYFVLGTAVFLILNGFWLEGRMRPKARSIFTTAALLCAGIFLFSNWLLAGLPLGRFDLTEGRMYTLSTSTKKILKSLKTPAVAKLYISSSEKMPTSMKTLEQDIADKLDELRIASGGKFQYKIFHMDVSEAVEKNKKKQSQEESFEEQLSKKGIQPFQVQSIDADEMGVRLIYSGLTLSYKEKPEEILPRIHPGNFDSLEYMIISKLYRMTLAEAPKVALVAPFQDRNVDPNLMALLQQLGGGQIPESYRDDPYEFLQMGLEYEGYHTSRITLDKKTKIPGDVKTLAVIEPRALNDRQKYEINEFLRKGGSVFLAAQNYEFNYRPTELGGLQLVPNEKKPATDDLTRAWGFELDSEVLADEQSGVINLNSPTNLGIFDMAMPVKLPIQILLSPSEMNPKISITSRLSTFFYLWGSALKVDLDKIKAQKLKLQVLLSSSKKSWTVPFKPGTMNPEDLNLMPKSPKGPFPLAILAQGQFEDAFKGKEVPAWPSEEPAKSDTGQQTDPKAKAQKPETVQPLPGKLVMIGAVTPFQRQLIQGGGHINFFLNAIDVLTLGDELIGIRSKGPVDRTLPKISRPVKVLWRFLVTLLVPILIALLGFGRAYLRRREKQQYLKKISGT